MGQVVDLSFQGLLSLLFEIPFFIVVEEFPSETLVVGDLVLRSFIL